MNKNSNFFNISSKLSLLALTVLLSSCGGGGSYSVGYESDPDANPQVDIEIRGKSDTTTNTAPNVSNVPNAVNNGTASTNTANN